MNMTTLLTLDRIACEWELSSRKRVFERLSDMLARCQTGLGSEAIFNALTNREKLGSTALGNGIAIPHACLPILEPCGALLRVEEGVKMDAPDKKPVQLFMAILVPTTQASRFSRFIPELTLTLLNKTLSENLQQCTSPEALWACIQQQLAPPETPYDTALAA